MVRFWTIISWGIILVLVGSNITDLYTLSDEHQLGLILAAFYTWIQVDLAHHVEEFDALQARVTKLENHE